MNKSVIINKKDFLIVLISIFTITTFTQDLWPFSINQVVGFFIFIAVLWNYMPIKNTHALFVFFCSICCVIYTLVFTEDITQNLSQAVYWLIGIWMLFLLSDSNFKESFYKTISIRKRIIKVSVIIGDAILIISLFLKDSYRNIWGGRYFKGLCASPHTLAAGCCLLLSLAVIAIHLDLIDEKSSLTNFVLIIPGAIGILQSGARTFIIPLFILLYIYYRYCIRSFSIKVISLPIGTIAVLYAFLNSGIYVKMLSLSTMNPNAISNGRFEFWLADIAEFSNSNIINKILGHGFDYITKINYSTIGAAIGGHNDYITCLLAVGIIGTLLYVTCLISLFRSLIKKGGKIDTILLIIYCIFPSLMNGFYGYVQLLLSYTLLISLYHKGLHNVGTESLSN